MDKKILAVIAVIIVVAAGACAAVLLLKGNDKQSNTSDYTILDGEEKVKAGEVYTITTVHGETTEVNTLAVSAVENGTVTYKITYSVKGVISDLGLTNFDKDHFLFDYTQGDYEGVTVTYEDNTYTLSGTGTAEYYGNDGSFTCTNLVIVTDGAGHAPSVKGGLSFSDDDQDMSLNVTCSTSSTGVFVAKGSFGYYLDRSGMPIGNVTNYYETITVDEFKGATVTDNGTEKYGNVTAHVYTVNGTTVGGVFYENFKFYEYNGFLLYSSGYVDGVASSVSITVHY